MAEQQDVIFNLKAVDGVSGVLGTIGKEFEELGTNVGGELGDILGRVGETFDQIGRSASLLGPKLTVIGGAFAGLGLAFLNFGSGTQQATDQLRTAIENTGASFDDYEKQIEEAIHTGENFAFSADDTKAALEALTESTQDPALALRALGAVMDFAAAKHETLASAASQVQRALNGNGKVLRQYGIDLHDIKDPAAKAEAAIAGLEARFGGQASASVQNFGSQLDVVKTKITDFASDIAGPIGQALSIVGTVTSAVGAVISVFQIRSANRLAAANVELAASETAVAGATTAHAAAAGEAAAAMNLEGDAALTTSGKLGTLAKAFGLAAVATVGISYGLDELDKKNKAKDAATGGYLGALQSGDTSKAIEKLKTQLDDYPSLLDKGSLGMTGFFQHIDRGTEVLKAINVPLEDVAKHLYDSDSAWADYKESLLSAANANGFGSATVDQLAHDLDAVRDSTSEAKKQYDSLAPSINDAQRAWYQESQTIALATYSLADVDSAQRDAQNSADKLANKNAALITQYPDLIDRNKQVAVSTETMKDRWSVYAGTVDDATTQTWGLEDSIGHMDVTIRQTIPSVDELYQSITTHQQDIHHAKDDFADAAAGIKEMNKQAKPTKQSVHDLYDKIIAAAGSAEKASGKTGDYIGTLEALRKKVKPGSELYKELSQLIALLNQVPGTRTADVVLRLTTQTRLAHGHAPSVYYPPPTPSKTSSGSKRTPGRTSSPAGAGGGYLNAGTEYYVGEEGPELFTPAHPGVLLPTGTSTSGVGAYSVTYNIYPKSTDPTEVVREIQKYERRNTSTWRASA